MKKTIILLTIQVIVLLSVTQNSLGQDPFEEEKISPALTIAPSILDLDVEAEQTIEKTIAITNSSDFSMPVQVEIMDYSVDDQGFPTYVDDPTDWSPKSWILPEPKDFILKAHEKREITIIISVPSKALAGSHFASIIFKPVLPPEYYQPHSSHIIPYIGAVMALNVISDKNQPKADFLEVIKFSPYKNLQSNPIGFEASFENTDVYYHKVEGEVYVENILGHQVSKIQIDNRTMLPKKSFVDMLELEDDLSFGRYNARLIIGDDQNPEVKYTSFWVLPSFFSAIVAAGLTSFSLFLLLVRKNIWHAIKILMSKNM